jgi:hypothetical protein
VTLIAFLGLSLWSTWAVDSLARSPRRLPARVACYGELFLPTILLPIPLAALVIFGVVETDGVRLSPTVTVTRITMVGIWAAVLAWVAVLVVAAHLGVIRRWRPTYRLGLYATWVAGPAGTVWLMTRA